MGIGIWTGKGVHVTDRPDFETIDRIAGAATVEESKLAEAVTSAGEDTNGLHLLVNHYGPSADWRVLGYIALALSRLAWQRGTGDERFPSVLSDFMATVRTRYHPGTLISTLNALHGLCVTETIELQHGPRRRIGEFLLRCLNHPDSGVRTSAVEVLCHLWDGGVLATLLAEDTTSGLRRRLADMAAREEDDLLKDDLKSLDGFWMEAGR